MFFSSCLSGLKQPFLDDASSKTEVRLSTALDCGPLHAFRAPDPRSSRQDLIRSSEKSTMLLEYTSIGKTPGVFRPRWDCPFPNLPDQQFPTLNIGFYKAVPTCLLIGSDFCNWIASGKQPFSHQFFHLLDSPQYYSVLVCQFFCLEKPRLWICDLGFIGSPLPPLW